MDCLIDSNFSFFKITIFPFQSKNLSNSTPRCYSKLQNIDVYIGRSQAEHEVTNKRTCKIFDLSSPLLYHGVIGSVRSVKDCPTAYQLRLVP